MKFLNIVIYCDSKDNDDYQQMKQITSFYYKSFGENVKTLYVKYNENTEKQIEEINDELIINGKETWIPGILDKTLDAFDYIVSKNLLDQYDYCIRTNISTIIDFHLLEKELTQNPIKWYGGGKSMELKWRATGMEDDSWLGTFFVQGTSIILSKDAVKFMCANRDKFHKEFIDDVAIAVFVKEHLSHSYPPQQIADGLFQDIPHFIENGKHNPIKLLEMVSNNNIIFYRNNCIFQNSKRQIDVFHMKIIVQELLKLQQNQVRN